MVIMSTWERMEINRKENQRKLLLDFVHFRQMRQDGLLVYVDAIYQNIIPWY